MNSVTLVGRLCRDVEPRTLKSGSVTADFTIAVDRRKRDGGADFIRCSAWGKTAELLGMYCRKGDAIAVSGHLHTDSYEKDGRKVSTCEVVAETIDFLGGVNR